MRQPGRTTAADVAAAAQVSIATVSLVVNAKADGRVASSTQARVRDAVDRLGYRVDTIARSLSTGQTRAIALVAPDMTNPFFSHVAMGVTQAVGDLYDLLLVVSDQGHHLRSSTIERVLALRVDGILIDAPGRQLVEDLRPTCPVVYLDAQTAEATPSVEFDLRPGVEALADHLLDLGHRRFGYLDASTDVATFSRRRGFFTRRVKQRWMDAAIHTASSGVDIDQTVEAFEEAWPAWSKLGVTSIVCATDAQAYGVLRVLHHAGIDVPSVISVVGFDDLPFSSVAGPSLTSVRLPAAQLGIESAQLLASLLDGREPETTQVVLPTSLVVRDSTGPAPRRANAIRGSG